MKKSIFFLSILIFTIFFVFSVFRATMKKSPINIGNKYQYISSLFPQGWSFFTKKIPKYEFDIYDNKKNKINTFNTNGKYYYGLKKSNRFLPYLVEKKLGEIDEKYWLQSRKAIGSINIDSLNNFKFKESIMPNFIKGKYTIKIYEITPWLYFSNNVKLNDKFYYINIEII